MGLFQVQNSTEGASAVTTATTTVAAGPVVYVPSGAGMQMVAGNDCYFPPTLTVAIGVDNMVAWVNNDDVPQTVTATDGSFNSGNSNAGQSWSHTFCVPGTCASYCAYHPWMKETIVVKAS